MLNLLYLKKNRIASLLCIFETTISEFIDFSLSGMFANIHEYLNCCHLFYFLLSNLSKILHVTFLLPVSIRINCLFQWLQGAVQPHMTEVALVTRHPQLQFAIAMRTFVTQGQHMV